MDQLTVNATQEFFTKQIQLKDERIQQLEAHIQKLSQRSYGEAAERDRMRNEMQEWALDQLNDSEISQSQAEDIANICGFDLTKEFELEVTVQYSVIVNARDAESAENLIHDIDFDSVSYPDGVEYLSATVDRIDI
jgi:restriction endonuclease S subunit